MIDYSPRAAAALASNIRTGPNPAYTSEDFREAMPGFGYDVISDKALDAYIELAHAVCKEARWHGLWREGMRLLIAHYVTLYLSAPEFGATREEIITGGRAKGIVTSKAVGAVNLSQDASQITGDLTGWGAYKLTTYGVQYATLARMVGKGAMYVM